GCQAAAAVQREDEPFVFLVIDTQPGIFFLIRIEDSSGTIRRAVVDHDQLKVTKGLVQEAIKGFGQELLAVEDAHNNGDERFGRHDSADYPRASRTERTNFRSAIPGFPSKKNNLI